MPAKKLWDEKWACNGPFLFAGKARSYREPRSYR